jgi:nucleoside-diphosphate-sugar epimerase
MKISILGCGWLGLPLAVSLIDDGHYVNGSTRDTGKLGKIKEQGINPYMLELSPELICENTTEFLNSEILILNIPPARRDDIVEFHPRQIQSIIDAISSSPVRNVVFTSSTSVYPELNREVTEDETAEPGKNSGKALKIVEKMLMNEPGFKTTVLRLAGLVGYDRNPRNFLKKRRVILKINTPVNLVHRDDCIGVIKEVVNSDKWGEIFNVCCDNHPKRIDFYKSEAEKAGIEIENPEDMETADYKLVSNKKLKNNLKYSLKYPDPLNME